MQRNDDSLIKPILHFRMKSNFELGCEQPLVEEQKEKKKSVTKKINPITGEVIGIDGEEEHIVKIVEKFEKSCKVPPGGHTTALW